MNRLLLFIIGSIGGWIYEYLIDGKVNYNFGLHIPFLFVYGIGLVIWYQIYLLFRYYDPEYKINIVTRFIIYATIMTIFEWIIGKLSYKYNGYHTWLYSNNMQISWLAWFVWGTFSIIIEYIANYYTNKNTNINKNINN